MLTTFVEKTNQTTVTKMINVVHVLPAGVNTSYEAERLHYMLEVNSANQMIKQVIAEPAINIVIVQSTMTTDGSIRSIVPVRIGMSILVLNNATEIDANGSMGIERLGSGIVNVVEQSNELEI